MPALTVKRQSLDRARCRLMAELGVESERYQDVVTEIKKIIFAHNARLTIEERSLLSIAYKNLTNNLRNSWRTVSALEGQIKKRIRSPQREREERLVRLQREKIESDLLDTCNDIVDLLDRYLLLAATPGEEAVFYSKMKGDYYRYLAEFGPVKDRGRFGEVSLQAYKAAYKRALATLHPLDPTRLGLALNFSVFYHGKTHTV
ncbi:14-3-3 protein [Coprinellus micaceus]|uniref:14-3-3 protein n=1 Tax=Coprinellus micaceus TaxID=71717 RepID=A0A4Y7T8F3_COPMI|nr:14-3-3 protein [Coprinellus micaceus]